MAITNVKQYVQNLVGMKLGNYQTNIKTLEKNCKGLHAYTYGHDAGGCCGNPKVYYYGEHCEFYDKKGNIMAASTESYTYHYKNDVDECTGFTIEDRLQARNYFYDESGKAVSLQDYRIGALITDNGNQKGVIDMQDTIEIDGKSMTIGDYLSGQ